MNYLAPYLWTTSLFMVASFATACLGSHHALRGAPQSHVLKTPLKAPPHYTFIDLGVSPDYSPAAATSINNHGNICGNIGLRSYKWVQGQKVSLGFLPQTPEERQPHMAHSTTANAINDRGVVVGADTRSMLDDSFPRAVMWRHGKTEDLGDGVAIAINNKNTVLIGNTSDGAFLWSNGKRSLIVDQSGMVEALNNHGDVVGSIRGHSVLWRRGKAQHLQGRWLKTDNRAVAINDHRSILVVANFAGKAERSYLWRNGKLTNLGQLASYPYTNAIAINNHDQIVGNAKSAFLWQNSLPYTKSLLVIAVCS